MATLSFLPRRCERSSLTRQIRPGIRRKPLRNIGRLFGGCPIVICVVLSGHVKTLSPPFTIDSFMPTKTRDALSIHRLKFQPESPFYPRATCEDPFGATCEIRFQIHQPSLLQQAYAIVVASTQLRTLEKRPEGWSRLRMGEQSSLTPEKTTGTCKLVILACHPQLNFVPAARSRNCGGIHWIFIQEVPKGSKRGCQEDSSPRRLS